MLRLRFLGPFQATLDGELVRGFRSDKGRALLAYLATQENRSRAREHLAGLLWGDDEERAARASLRQVLSNWRRIFAPLLIGDPPPLVIGRRTVRLRLDTGFVWADVAQLQSLLAANALHRHATILACEPCHERLVKAVSLYQGEFLADVRLSGAGPWFDDWRLVQQEHHHQLILKALGQLAANARAAGDHDQEIDYLRRQLALLPWLEGAHRDLMTAFAATGRFAEAMAQYETCRHLLNQELAVDPAPDTQSLYDGIVAERAAQSAIAAAPKYNLPPARTSFVGRENELAQIREILTGETTRLLTLSGLGGVGKTRLALAAAEQLRPTFAAGAWFISFADVPVGPTNGLAGDLERTLALIVLESLGQRISERERLLEQLCAYLRPKTMLLILDNLEQLLPDATDFVLALHDAAPQVRIIVTSQVPLHCQAEINIALTGLPTSPIGRTGREQTPSMQLFVERARRHQPEVGVQLAERDARLVGEICRLADGFPLAIELAAELVNHYTLAEIAAAINDNLDLLSSPLRDLPPRQRSMRAVLDYGWALLAEQEQRVLAQASVFGGQFDREAALAITDASLPDLVNLVRRSWIILVRPGRYLLHGLVRQLAADILAESPRAQAETEARFARYFASFLGRQAADFRNANQGLAQESVNREFNLITRAWGWFVDQGDSDRLEAMMPGIGHFLADRGRYWDGLQLFTAALERRAPRPVRRAARVDDHLAYWRAHFLYRNGRHQRAHPELERLYLAFLARQDTDYLAATALDLGRVLIELGVDDTDRLRHILEEALTIYEAQRDDHGAASALTALGHFWVMVGDYHKASVAHQRSLHHRREIGAPRQLAFALNQWGLLLYRQGAYERANELFQESADLDRQTGSLPELAAALANRGLVETALGRYAVAEALLKEAWQIQENQGNRSRIAIILNNLGDIANLQGHHGQALGYLEESQRIKRAMNNKRGMTFTLIHLGHAHFGLQAYVAAERSYRQALQFAMELTLPPLALDALVGLAQLLSLDQQAQGLLLLQLPLSHPASWQRTREHARQLADHVAASLSPTEVVEINERGQDLDLEVVVEAILGHE